VPRRLAAMQVRGVAPGAPITVIDRPSRSPCNLGRVRSWSTLVDEPERAVLPGATYSPPRLSPVEAVCPQVGREQARGESSPERQYRIDRLAVPEYFRG